MLQYCCIRAKVSQQNRAFVPPKTHLSGNSGVLQYIEQIQKPLHMGITLLLSKGGSGIFHR